jgi:proliferating cell nuclear antigen
MSSEGDTDDVEYEPDDYIDIEGEPVASLFSLDYMKDMNKAIPKGAGVVIELGDEMPIKMHYDFAEGLGNVTYMLAPRIQSD